VKLESHVEERVMRPLAEAHDRAVDDTRDAAQRNASRYSRTGRFADSIERTPSVETQPGRMAARVGSPLVSARAKEKGAFIAAKRGDYLVFDAGSGVRKVRDVRLPARPVVGPAVARWPETFAARAREALA
jgi:hypothetical protein